MPLTPAVARRLTLAPATALTQAPATAGPALSEVRSSVYAIPATALHSTSVTPLTPAPPRSPCCGSRSSGGRAPQCPGNTRPSPAALYCPPVEPAAGTQGGTDSGEGGGGGEGESLLARRPDCMRSSSSSSKQLPAVSDSTTPAHPLVELARRQEREAHCKCELAVCEHDRRMCLCMRQAGRRRPDGQASGISPAQRHAVASSPLQSACSVVHAHLRGRS